MISGVGGFIIADRDTPHYRVGTQRPEEGQLDTPFFHRSTVKSVGESHCCLQQSRSGERAAARGSCGVIEVKAA